MIEVTQSILIPFVKAVVIIHAVIIFIMKAIKFSSVMILTLDQPIAEEIIQFKVVPILSCLSFLNFILLIIQSNLTFMIEAPLWKNYCYFVLMKKVMR